MKSIKIGKTFSDRVRDVVRSIPKGKTMTYGEVARLAGAPGAARAVGTVMAHNFDKTVPCHRVIRADGNIGNYNRGGSAAKRKLLITEGALS
jgi:methylated-DNA-[protein]-cysteine S-methyltransferase